MSYTGGAGEGSWPCASCGCDGCWVAEGRRESPIIILAGPSPIGDVRDLRRMVLAPHKLRGLLKQAANQTARPY